MKQTRFYRLVCFILVLMSFVYCGETAMASVRKQDSMLISTIVDAVKPSNLGGGLLDVNLVSSIYTVKSETSMGNVVDVIVKLDKDLSQKYFGPAGVGTLPESSFIRAVLLDCDFFPVAPDGLSVDSGAVTIAERSYDGNGILSSLRFRYLRSDGQGEEFKFQIEAGGSLTTNFETTLEMAEVPDGGDVDSGDVIGGDDEWAGIGAGEGDDEESSESSSKPEIAVLKPHLIVDAYSYGDVPVTAGKDFNLSFTLRNTSKTRKIENAIIVVSTSEDLSIKSTSNTIHVDEIAPMGTVGRTVTLNLKVAASEKVHQVTIESKFQYHDKKETDPVDGEDSIIISVPSSKIERAKITGITPPKEIVVDKEESIEFSVINNGFGTIYNMEAFVYDEEENEIGWQFVGNVEGGTQPKTNKFPVTFETGGVKNLKLVVQYETENLQLMTMEREFQLSVELPEEEIAVPPMMPPTEELFPEEEFGMEGEEEVPKETNYLLISLIAVVIVAVIIVIVVRIIRRREDNFDDFFEAFPTSPEQKPKNVVTVEMADKKGRKSKKADKK